MYTSKRYLTGDSAIYPLVAQQGRIIEDLRTLLVERDKHFRILERTHLEALVHLAIAAEYRDGDTGLHIIRIGQLAGALAELLTGDRRLAVQLCRAAPLHDVGKIGIPDSVLKKPGPLTPDEWKVMYQHPVIGAKILGCSSLATFRLAAEVALNHHEKFDGSGYPSGLKGDAIPFSAKVVSVVDYYDALTMDRVYRKSMPHDAVLGMMAEESGKKFDPLVVDMFLVHSDKMLRLRNLVNEKFASLQLESDGVRLFEPVF